MTLALSACQPEFQETPARNPSTEPPPPTEPSPNEPLPSGNRSPVVSGVPSVQVTAGSPYSFQPRASDADGDELVFSAVGLPDWASIDSRTGLIQGTPGEADVGTTGQIIVRVWDGMAAASLPAFFITVVPAAQQGTGFAELTWTPPTQNTDGSPLSAADVAAYRIYMGNTAASLRRIAEVGGSTTAFKVEELDAGTHHFAVTAVSRSGIESGFSKIGSKTIM